MAQRQKRLASFVSGIAADLKARELLSLSMVVTLLAQLELQIAEAADGRLSTGVRRSLVMGVVVFAWLFGPVYQALVQAQGVGSAALAEPLPLLAFTIAALALLRSDLPGVFDLRYNSLKRLRTCLQAIQVNLQKSSETRPDAGAPHDSNIQEQTISGS